MDAIAAIAEQGLKVTPCLFNRWHDVLCAHPYKPKQPTHLRSLLEQYASISRDRYDANGILAQSQRSPGT